MFVKPGVNTHEPEIHGHLLKVRSGTAGVPVIQTPGATVTLIGRSEIF